MGRRRSTSQFFRRFIAAYAVALSVFVVFGIVVYQAGITELRRYLIGVETARFEEQIERFRFQIDLVQSIPLIVDAQDSTTQLSRIGPDDIQRHIQLIQEYADYIGTLDILNAYTSSIAVYFHRTQIYVGEVVSTRTNVIYEDVLRVQDWDYQRWHNFLVDPETDGRFFDLELRAASPRRGRDILYLRQIPIESFRTGTSATVLARVSVNDVLSSFSAYSQSSDGFIVMYDPAGSLVTEQPAGMNGILASANVPPLSSLSLFDAITAAETEINGQFYLLLSGSTGSPGWTIVSGIPLSFVTQRIRSVPILFLVVAVAALTAFTAIAVTFAQKNSRLIERVMDILNNRQNESPLLKVGGFDSLYALARKVVQDRQALDYELEMRNVWLQGSTVERLMRGLDDPEEPLEKLLSSVGLEISGDQFFVAALRVSNSFGPDDAPRELALHPKIVRRAIIERTGISVLTHVLSVDTVGFIFGYEREGFDQVRAEVENAFDYLKEFGIESKGRSYFVGLGAPRDSLREISQSTEEALAAIDYSTAQNGYCFADYDEIVSDEIYTSFPVELEAKLSRVINTSNESDAEQVFKNIFPAASIRAKWSMAYKEQFKSFVMGIVIKLFSMESVASFDSSVITIGTFRELQEQDDLDEFRERVLTIVKELIRYKQSLRNEKDEKQIERIIEMIDTHYTDPDFSVSSISDAMHITPGYLSSLFKEHEGESISARIESVRLERAAQLLSSTDQHIQEIQNSVGYRNANTFYKAFKRRFGRSPKEYRADKIQTV